ncbi:uncharacterized protein LOC135371171 [Ornithodoros turicata]|uniref:uncharacterized protein LOC135371171 n=1 Tax=Ornithodoros turicata TaxID=34597 RepID=UPI00313929F6
MEDEVEVPISLSAIYQFVGKSPEDSARSLQEGEQVYNAGHVVECSVADETSAMWTLSAFVLQTTAPFSDPHRLTLDVAKTGGVNDALCTCRAGNFLCKHMVAVLLHVRSNSHIHRLSQTDKPQMWGKEQRKAVKEKYCPTRFVNLPCTKQVRQHPLLTRLQRRATLGALHKICWVLSSDCYSSSQRRPTSSCTMLWSNSTH